jgi:hypothetical protein
MRIRLCVFSLLLCVFVSVFVSGRIPQREEKADRSKEDAPLESYQVELLDIAFSAASSMPVFPHIKNRSQAQETVVTTCFELDQPQRALRYIEQIENWRRGACFADLALFYAQHGAMKKKTEPYLMKATQLAEAIKDWRRDRIRVKIAQTYTWLGQRQEAQAFVADVENSEKGKVIQVGAMRCPLDSFDETMQDIDTLISAKNFDIVKNALEAYPELYNCFYTDIQRRTLIEKKLKASWNSMPVSIRIDLLTELVDFSLAHEDRTKACELVNEAKVMMDSVIWRPRFGIPVKAKLAGFFFQAGDKERARIEMQEALSQFETNREKIVNIYRAGVLRSIAEAYQVMGETVISRKLYRWAIEAGIENPNSRPRAEDLAATCCSMAVHAVEPGTDLFSRIREIRDGLSDPW